MSQRFVFAFASLFIAFFVLSCNDFNDDEMIGLYEPPHRRPSEPPPLSVSHTEDSVLYTFTIPRLKYGMNDTLSAIVTLYNQSMSVKNIGLNCNPALSVNWSLNNSSGQTLIYGPQFYCVSFAELHLSAHQLLQYVFIDEPIKNIQTRLLGQSGPYVLEGQMVSATTPPWFTFNVSIVSPSPPLELISNSSFESNGTFSLNGWGGILRTPVDSMKEAPPGGGTWSVEIEGENGTLPLGYLTFTVPVPVGVHIYKFSVWTKYDDTIGTGGYASLVLDGVDTVYGVNNFHISDTAWTLQSAIDTLKTISGDSLQVRLGGALEAPFPFRTLFDLVKLEVVK